MLPGYARPNLEGPGDFERFDIGVRQNPVIKWRPIGAYMEAGVNWNWGVEPGTIAFELHPDNPLNYAIAETGIRRKAYHVRVIHNGLPWTGRIFQRRIIGKGPNKRWLYTGKDNKAWLQRSYAWVNPLFPPEIQVGLTGKQDVQIGPIDPVFKNYISRNFIRLNRPLYCALPIKWPGAFTIPDLEEFNSLDSLLDFAFDALEEVIIPMARFTQHDELFKLYAENLNVGISVDLWDGTGTPPHVFNTSSLAALSSILDHTSDHFLDLGQLAKPINNGLWSNTPHKACYVFDTHVLRDNRKVQLRTDSQGQVAEWEMIESHADASRAIVGGKAPSLVNDLIEIGANLAISAIIAGLSMIPGLQFLGGLAVTVGSLFDDIFFAYQVFVDHDLEGDLGDDGLPEIFADNTAAWSLDSYAVGKGALREHGGGMELNLDLRTGIPGRGVSFGVDNQTARRYQLGDIVTFWDEGNTIERHVSGVSVTSKPGQRMRESLTLGTDKRAKGAWTRLLNQAQGFSAFTKGIANST